MKDKKEGNKILDYLNSKLDVFSVCIDDRCKFY